MSSVVLKLYSAEALATQTCHGLGLVDTGHALSSCFKQSSSSGVCFAFGGFRIREDPLIAV